MDDRIETVDLTVIGIDRDADGEVALETLRHVDAYDGLDALTNRLSNLSGLGPEDVDGAHVVYADHVPDEFDVQEDEPTMFDATQSPVGTVVEFRAEDPHIEDCFDALRHALAVSDLDLAQFRVRFDIDADLTAGRSIEDVPDHPDYMRSLDIDTDAGRSNVSLSLIDLDTTLEDESDVADLEARLDDTIEYAERCLP